MRKSGAPSQASNAEFISKKPRFVSPALQNKVVKESLISSTKELSRAQPLDVLAVIQSWSSEDDMIRNNLNSCSSRSESDSQKKRENSENIGTSIKSFSAKFKNENNSFKTGVLQQSVQQTAAFEGSTSKYFAVMWCKFSKKKHKTWEGDAILVTTGRTVKLLDTDGKEIGHGTGYKVADLESLSEGETLVIGGKEIEILNVIKDADFHSGRCFRDVAVTESTERPPERAKSLKPFTHPMLGCDERLAKYAKPVNHTVTPRFDPTAPGALVMPAPSEEHQAMHNTGRLPVVDVVVDPHVSRLLRPHQRLGVTFLYECVMGMRAYTGEGVVLADEMGLGKTFQCICLIWTLLKQGPYGGKPVVRRVLIITPSSLVKNWCKEFKIWLGYERLRVFAVDQQNKAEDYAHSPAYPVLLISYEMFVRYAELLKTVQFDLIVCDEGHRLKNNSIKTSTIIGSLPTRKRILLTGTPVQNNLEEFFSIIDFCNPGILGSVSSFRKIYEEPIVAARQQGACRDEKLLGEERASELSRLTSLFVLRRTQQVNASYLPPKTELVLFCQPTAEQVSVYDKLLSSCLDQCLCSSDAALHLACISALKKICNHPLLLFNKITERHDENSMFNVSFRNHLKAVVNSGNGVCQSGKMTFVTQLLDTLHGEEGNSEKIVIASHSTQTLDLIEKLCDSRSFQYLRLDGKTATAKRQQLVDLFNNADDRHRVFLLSTKAGGVGLNLIGASRLILYDVDWNPANDLQAMARIWRDGQRREVFIYRLLTTGTIEERIYQRQIYKQHIGASLADAQSKTASFTQDELRDLFAPVCDTLSLTHDLLQCDCGSVLDSVIDESDASERGDNDYDAGSGISELRDCDDDDFARPSKVFNTRPQRQLVSKVDSASVAELRTWNHISGPSPSVDVDPLLANFDLHHLSYVFWKRELL